MKYRIILSAEDYLRIDLIPANKVQNKQIFGAQIHCQSNDAKQSARHKSESSDGIAIVVPRIANELGFHNFFTTHFNILH